MIIHVAKKYDIDIVAGTVVELGTQPHADILADHPVSSPSLANFKRPFNKSRKRKSKEEGDKIPHRKPKSKKKLTQRSRTRR